MYLKVIGDLLVAVPTARMGRGDRVVTCPMRLSKRIQ
jgi:hypothetical protein